MPLSVLLVEDDRELRATLRSALEVEGWRVLAAASLADARALWAHAAEVGPRIDIVLLDRGTALQPAVTQYRRGALHIDLAARRVALRGQTVHLTPTEFKLLARLLRSAAQVVTHRALLAEVWGPEFTEHTHYLRLYMGQLRAKLEADPADPQLLLTEPGVGYRLAEGEAIPPAG